MIPRINSVIGYGTFITRGYWENKLNVEPCIVNKFSRIFPKGFWFPVVIPSTESFWALKFDVTSQELKSLDHYEGVHLGIFERKQADIILKSGDHSSAIIYVPTENFIKTNSISLELDPLDKWKEKIRSFPKIISKFPELIL